jgi:pantoate--beta-alanine ligase
MRAWATQQQRAGLRLALVPTMGFFHEGHLSLMRKAAKQADQVVVSLFVNPTQFGPQEDLATYPRNFERDQALAAQEGVAVLFAPEAAAMYPQGFMTHVNVGEALTSPLCGASRPGHFAGVATVVCKLFSIVHPQVAVFGEKDMQQVAVIRRMTADLDLGVEIIAHPTIREPDGLAMSSRNSYLRPEERVSALSLSQALALARTLVAQGQTRSPDLLARLRDFILSFPYTSVDYLSVVHRHSLQDMAEVNEESMLALAVQIGGRVRLIDNGPLYPALNILNTSLCNE